MGDFNAKVGEGRIDNIVGPYGLGDSNERGERLVDWCREKDMLVANTWFPIHPRRRWTWSSPGDRSRNQIDSILVKRRLRNSVQYAKAMPGGDCGSDHNPVVCQIKLKLKAFKKAKRSPRYQFEALKKDEIRERYNVLVKNKFETLVAVTTAEEKWNQLKDCIQEGIEEQVPKRARKEHKKMDYLRNLRLDGKVKTGQTLS
ncbi:craniofacial development protein 2-like [Elysia marginata]|uniref:Craniofacial development protein 2-like n=1 Tax=Elysia marginata TaxID=1093978 RepID=A0AAV4I4E1_9GAST|nr:craniofacial development protein 2-like [Elysia marginata]